MTQSETSPRTRTYKGTIEEVMRHRSEIPTGATVELKVFEMDQPLNGDGGILKKPKISVLGKYSFVAGGSDEFAKDKQREIDREDAQSK